ncbi:MAG: FeoB-associated Cys-rich membrane protein [Christensenellaceae bacterium]
MLLEIILMILIALAIAAVVWYMIKKRRKGECIGCSDCNRSRSCKNCPKNTNPKNEKK